MKKTLYSDEQQVFLALLRQIRHERGLTQAVMAKRLSVPQSFISDYETGSRKLDTLQMRQVCEAMETTLPEFAARLEEAIAQAIRSRNSGV